MTSDRDTQGAPQNAAKTLVALAALLSVAAGALLVWMLWVFWPFTVDDTFITLRYAEHLAAGHGPVYNLEPPRAEGYTSFLWMIVLALPHLVGVDAVLTAKLLGACFGAAAVGIAYALTAHLCAFLGPRLRILPAAFAASWLAGFAPTAVHSVSGMETSVAAFLFTAFVYCAVTARTVAMPVLGLLLGMARPEANAVVAPTLLYAFFSAGPAVRGQIARTSALLYVAPGALYFGWRAWYFGHLFPIPFYMKVASQGVLAGSDHALAFARKLLEVVGFPLAGCLLRPHRAPLLALAAGLAWLAISALPADIMDYDYRFAFPAAPVLFAAAGYGVAVWLRMAMQVRDPNPAAATARVAAVAVLLAVASHLTLFEGHDTILFNRRSYGEALGAAHIRLGKILAAFEARQDRRPVIALGDAGAIPYYSGWRTLDTFGLNDPEIGIRGNFDPAHFLDPRPDLVVIVSEAQREFRATKFFPREADFYAPIRAAGYQQLAVLPFSMQSYLWIMGDPESDVGRHVRDEIRKLIESQRATP